MGEEKLNQGEERLREEFNRPSTSPLACASLGVAPFDFAPFGLAQGKQGKRDKRDKLGASWAGVHY